MQNVENVVDVRNEGTDGQDDWLLHEAGAPIYGSDNAVVRLSFELALSVLAYVSELEGHRRYVVARQLVRCGTSVGANVREAQYAESRADFIHKCKIAAKEAEETDYWLQLCTATPDYPTPLATLTGTLLSVRRVLARIIISSKANALKAAGA